MDTRAAAIRRSISGGRNSGTAMEAVDLTQDTPAPVVYEVEVEIEGSERPCSPETLDTASEGMQRSGVVSQPGGETPCMGRGLWKLNSSLLEDATIRQSFEEFFQGQEPLVDLCNSKSEWWEMFKTRTARFFRELSYLRCQDRNNLYQELRKKLESLVSTGGSREDISRVKSLLKRCQYDRYASLVVERDFGKYRSPNPYGNCKMSVKRKLVTGLIDSTGSLNRSKSGILEVVRSFYSHLLSRKELDRDKLSAFLAEAVPKAGMDPSLDVLS
ncbi:uncharacterized protein LOC122920075 [Bufo gargarizans]|uniref:uncharacterized protein LOC122920075 n=1 Tax=Bufo gargarizans TaxID=30331 RepID=UPI001CF4F4D4|nr:uncharacterized protein LOC122920075 [Bufo gargarizans]